MEYMVCCINLVCCTEITSGALSKLLLLDLEEEEDDHLLLETLVIDAMKKRRRHRWWVHPILENKKIVWRLPSSCVGVTGGRGRDSTSISA